MHKIGNKWGYVVLIRENGKTVKNIYKESMFDIEPILEHLEIDGFTIKFFDTITMNDTDVDIWIAE